MYKNDQMSWFDVQKRLKKTYKLSTQIRSLNTLFPTTVEQNLKNIFRSGLTFVSSNDIITIK